MSFGSATTAQMTTVRRQPLRQLSAKRHHDTTPPGERFPRAIEHAVGTCDALLALIGPSWLGVTDGGARVGWITPMTTCV